MSVLLPILRGLAEGMAQDPNSALQTALLHQAGSIVEGQRIIVENQVLQIKAAATKLSAATPQAQARE